MRCIWHDIRMTERVPPEIPKRKLPIGLASGSMVVSLLGFAAYILVGLCAVAFVIGLGLLAYGASHGIRPLIIVGLVLALGAMAWTAIMVPVVVVLSGAQIFSVVGSVIALRQSGEKSRHGVSAPGTTRLFALIGVILSGFVLLVFAFGLYGYREQQNRRRHEIDPDYIVRVAHYVQSYSLSRDEPWRFAPSMAAAAMGESDRFEMIMKMPTSHISTPIIPRRTALTDWPKYAAAIDAASDYRYVGCDLVHSRALRALEPRIIILYNKKSYDGGRYVAFADMTQRWVKNGDLPALFADASAARAMLGLPPITLDGPAPPVPLPPP